MKDQQSPQLRAKRLAARTIKRCDRCFWEQGTPKKHGGVGTLRCHFFLDAGTPAAVPYLFCMVFVIKKHAKGDEVLSHYADVVSPRGGEPVASQRWPASLEEACTWAEMVAALDLAENPLRWYSYGHSSRHDPAKPQALGRTFRQGGQGI